ncbi:MAG: prolyl-tRNA synthetase associated domain-containing protein [Campylobacteraceae bacterium]|nr:prolyl-tRNA synthetase associated domain-containing protein [Campylobacteraceae bacterium]
MKKQDIYKFLKEKNIEFEVTEHKAVFSIDESFKLNLPYPDRKSKNLFLKDSKKEKYYLMTIKGAKRANLKEFKKELGTNNLSFAPESDLFEILKLTKGSVTPLGLLNDESRKVEFYLDSEFLYGLIGIHPNDNTATVWMSTKDLIKLIKEHGNSVFIKEIS